ARINGEIVLRETMHGVKVPAGLTGAPVTPLLFSTLQLGQRTVHSDKEHVKWRQQLDQIGQPLLLLNDVIHDQVVAGLSQGWQTAMEPVKDSRAHASPVELAVPDACHGQGVGRAQMIERPMQEGFGQLLLQRARKRRFPCARRTVEQDDLAWLSTVVHQRSAAGASIASLGPPKRGVRQDRDAFVCMTALWRLESEPRRPARLRVATAEPRVSGSPP